MRSLPRFWRSLETLSGCATVAEQWKQMTGDEHESARRFLRPAGELASFFPHPDPGICVYRVVTHAPDDHVAICDETGERIALRTEDLVLYELDRMCLERALVKAFGFLSEDCRPSGQPRPWQIGQYNPLAGYRFSVFLLILTRRTDILQAVCQLAAGQHEPFVLCAPTGRLITEEARLLLRQACFMPLDEATCTDDTGRLVASRVGQRVLEDFRCRVVPQANEQPEHVFFPTPGGASWTDLKMRLVDGHTLSVSVGTARGVFNFAQLGMANRKNATPTVQWELLREFAAGYGILTWRSAGAGRKNKKRRENLARDLERFFRIEGDPFVRHGDGWRARFQIEPDR